MSQDNTNSATPRRLRRVRTGFVTSNKCAKTIRVEVNYLVKHPKYGKMMRRRTVLRAHDEKNEAKIGDKVEVTQCRPMSKTKAWRLVKVLSSHSTVE
jgi:small subunit ribosomal protein S17